MWHVWETEEFRTGFCGDALYQEIRRKTLDVDGKIILKLLQKLGLERMD